MRTCPECGLAQDMTVDPVDPNRVTLWDNHLKGCSWSPMVEPTQTIHRWRVRNVERTDTPRRTG